MRPVAPKARTGARRACGRAITHALLLVTVVLAVGMATLAPAAATAQTPSTEPAPSDGPPAAGLALPAEVQLRVGETAALDGGALQVELVQVAEDSRCPMDALCVWLGRAVVVLHVIVDGVDRGEVTVTLYPGTRPQSSSDLDATVDRYVLSLVDLQPYPRASQPQPLDQRVVTIHVMLVAP
jgi:hypothetical protein